MIRTLPRVALQLWIVLYIVFFGAEIIHLEPTLRVVTQFMYGIPLVGWGLWRLRGPADRLDLAVLGGVAVFAMVCLLSRDRTESLGALALAAANATWFVLMRRAADLRSTIVVAIATGLALTLAFNAYLLVQEKLAWYAAVGSAPFEGVVTFPWESVNALPMLVLVAIPFVAWLGRARLRAVLAAVVAVSAVVVVPLSLGRAGWLGLAVAAVGSVLMAPVSLRWLKILPNRQRLIGMVGVSAIVLAGAVLLGPRAVASIGESGRLQLWDQALHVIGSSPIIGSGPGSYSWARLDAPPAVANLLAVRLTHNVPLQTLFDGGLVLLAGILVLLIAWFAAAWARRAQWSIEDRIALACVVGFAAALMLDDFSYLPALTATALTVAAFLVPLAPAKSGAIHRWMAPVVICLAALIALPSIVAVDRARGAAQTARTAMVDGRFADAANEFEIATRAHPENGGYWLGLGMAEAYFGNGDAAANAYGRAIEASPGDARGYAGLAALRGEDTALLDEAVARTHGDAQYAVRLGVSFGALGLTDDASHAWARAVALRPELLLLLPYARYGLSMGVVAAEAVHTIQSEPRPAPGENLSKLWDIGLALDELPTDADLAWRAVDAARHGDLETARTMADAAIAEASYQARGHQAAAAVAAFACDPAAELAALKLEEVAHGSFGAPPGEPAIRREFVYREASLGPAQPPGVGLGIETKRWPWSLVARPDCS